MEVQRLMLIIARRVYIGSSHVLSEVVGLWAGVPYSVRISIIFKGRYVDLCSGHLTC